MAHIGVAGETGVGWGGGTSPQLGGGPEDTCRYPQLLSRSSRGTDLR